MIYNEFKLGLVLSAAALLLLFRSFTSHIYLSFSTLTLLPTLLCSISCILLSFTAICNCCIHYQLLVMHIYCPQCSYLIQHVRCVRVNLPLLAYMQPCYCHGQHKHLLFTEWFIYELSLLTFSLHPFPRQGRMAGLINCRLPCPAKAPSHVHTPISDKFA